MEQDKENLKTPTRAPFQEVGNMMQMTTTPTILKRVQYSQVTPFFTPKAKTPLRNKSQAQCARRSLSESSSDVPLNSLIYKKVMGIISEKQQEHENQLEEKNAEIERLQHQLTMLTLPADVASGTDTVDCGCSPYPTPTPLITHKDAKGETDQTYSANVNKTEPSKNIPSPTLTEPYTQERNYSAGFLPQLDSISSLEMLDCPVLETLDLSDAEVFGTPGRLSPGNPHCQTSHNKEMSVTPLKFASVETMVTPHHTTSAQVGTTPVSTRTQITSTDTIRSVDTAINTSMGIGIDIETNTDIIVQKDSDSNTDVTESRHIETNTERVCQVEMSTVMTPVRTHSVSSCTSPAVTYNKETCTTPPRSGQLVNRSAGTSPAQFSIPRPSEIDFNSLGVEDLALQLESASVSNTLLRDQIESLQQEKSVILRQASHSTAEVKRRDDELKRLEAEVVRREKLAKMSASTHVEELMVQQSELLSQISSLKSELEERNAALGDANAAHEKKTQTMKAELCNLRKDLVAAYQQRKREVEELKAENLNTSYKSHYEKARKEVVSLKARLKAFSGLGDKILEAHTVQEEAVELVSRKAREVEGKMELITQHFKLHREWEQQQQEFEKQRDSHQQQMSDKQAEIELLKEQLTDAQHRISKLTDEVEKTVEQDKIHFVEMASVHAALKLKSDELTAAEAVYKVKSEELLTLSKEKERVQHAMTAQTEAMSRLVQERDRFKKLVDQQRSSLNTLRDSAKRTDLLQDDLRDLHAKYEFLSTENALLKAEEATSQQRIKELSEENSQLRERTVQAGDRLEEARAQHSMILDHKESVHTASLGAFDSLIEKVTLLRTRINFCKLQCVPEPETAPPLDPLLSRRSVQVPSAITDKARRGTTRKSFITSVLRAVSGVDSPTLPLPAMPDKEDATEPETIDEDATLPEQMEGLGRTLDSILSTVEELANQVAETSMLRDEVKRLQETVSTQNATLDRYKNQKIKLNYNWKAAEEELKKLEQIIETIREVLCVHESEIKSTWREAKRLDRLGMFANDNTTYLLNYDPDALTSIKPK